MGEDLGEDFDPLEDARASANAADSRYAKQKGYENYNKAKDEYDKLLQTVEKEARFLAKCYIAAKYFNRLEEYKTLLERAIKLKPKKVKAAGETFGALSRIYEKLCAWGQDERRILIKEKRWTGATASSFDGYFEQVLRHMGAGTDGVNSYGLSHLASSSKRLVDAFAEGLTNWRNDVAEAIIATAEEDREREEKLREKLLDTPAYDPISPIAKTLDLLLTAVDTADRKGSKRDLIWFSEFADAMKVKEDVPNDNEFAENYFHARETFTEHVLDVNPAALKKAIGNILGMAQTTDEIPSFLQGEHGMPTIWLKPEDLGDVAHFYDGWVELCRWRENEARDTAGVLHHTAQRLTTALADFIDTDQEIAATFPNGQELPIQKSLEELGLRFDGSKDTVYGYSDTTGPQPDSNRIPEHTAEQSHPNVPRGPE